MKIEIQAPLILRNSFSICGVIFSLRNVVNMVLSSVSIDTVAEASDIALDAENTGLLYFLYLMVLVIAIVRDVKV